MQLWLLTPNPDNDCAWEPWYDKAFGFVVRAETEWLARELAASRQGDEGHGDWDDNGEYVAVASPWQDNSQSLCVPLPEVGDAKVILRDFKSA
tara:strand:- start:131 stop:409 length:279 start_codon:yes stop_codon:yes gene_type:complete